MKTWQSRAFLWPVLCVLICMASAGCQVVDSATGVNNANVGQSMGQPAGMLTRKELAQKLRRLAMSYLGEISQFSERVTTDNPDIEQRLRALRIRVDSADSVVSIAADPDPQVSLLNMVTILTLQRMLAEEWGEEFFGDRGVHYINSANRMEDEVWKIAYQVLDEEEASQLRELIVQYRRDHSEGTYVWWVRFSEFSAYREMFSVASIGRGVVDIFVPVGDAVANIESTSDIAERATWLGARQSLIVQWRLELAYTLAVNSPETQRMFDEIGRASTTIADLPNHLSAEREAILASLEDQEQVLGSLIAQADGVVTNINQALQTADQTVLTVQATVDTAGQTVEQVREAVTSAEQSLTNAGELLPQAESTLAQLEQTSNSLNQTILALDTFTRQFDSDEGDGSGDPSPSRPFDINEYTLAVQEAGKTVEQLNVLVTNMDAVAQPQRLDTTLGSVRSQVSSLIWQAGFVLLGVGLILILVVKLVPRRGVRQAT